MLHGKLFEETREGLASGVGVVTIRGHDGLVSGYFVGAVLEDTGGWLGAGVLHDPERLAVIYLILEMLDGVLQVLCSGVSCAVFVWVE